MQNSQVAGNKGNFENTAADIAILNAIVDYSNFIFSNVKTPDNPQTCYCGSNCFIGDTRIRIELTNIYFHYDVGLYKSKNSSLLLNTYGVNRGSELNIFFRGDNVSGGAVGGKARLPSYYDMSYDQVANFKNYNQAWEAALVSTDPNAIQWYPKSISNNFVHELAHNFGLLHLYSQKDDVETINPNNYEYLKDFWGDGSTGCTVAVPYSQWCCTSDPLTCSKNILGAYCGRDDREITPMQMGRIHRNTMLSSLRKYVKVSSDLEADHIVSANEQWDFNIRMYGNIVIKSGHKLTLRCKVLMPPTSKIIVEQGAELIIDGGMITTIDDSYLWAGIEVWGNSAKSQIPTNGVMYQGKLTLKNGATIENAEDAIILWKKGDWNTIGGIVDARDATFKNNKRTVEFLAYQNFIPNKPSTIIDNFSKFKQCSFIQTKVLNGGIDPYPMATLWKVKGVKFIGCNFEFIESVDFNPSFNRTGIYSIDASYSVTSFCNSTSFPCSPANTVRSTFKKFTNGVVATGATSYSPVTVKNSLFEDCSDHGIVIDDVDDSKIISNEFKNVDKTVQVGLYISNSTGYTVEANAFTKSGSNLFLTGIWVNNSGGELNTLYKNTFTGINKGILSTNDNFILSAQTEAAGLKFLCNDLSNSQNADMYVFGGNGAAIIQSGGNASSGPISAGNVFASATNYLNNSTLGVQVMYYYNGASQNPTGSNIIKVPGVKNTCISLNSELPDVKVEEITLKGFKMGFDNSQTDYINSLYMYFLSLDGGNSSSLVNQIQTSYFSQTQDLRNELIASSPLSFETIMATIDENVLSNAQLYDVLLENVEALRNEEVIIMLEQKVNPMPSYMLTSLINISEGVQDKDVLENNVAHYDLLRKRNMYQIIKNYSLLENDGDLDSLRLWIAKTNNEFFGLKKSIEFELAYNNTSGVNNLLTQIENTAYSVPEFTKERDQMVGFYTNYISNFIVANKVIWPSDNTVFENLTIVSESSDKYVANKAANLIRYNNMGYYWLNSLPEGKGIVESRFEKLKNSTEPGLALESSYAKVMVFPNPSNGTFNLVYPYSISKGLSYDIYDLNSVKIAEGKIISKETKINIKVTSGTYLLEVFENGNLLITKQVIIN